MNWKQMAKNLAGTFAAGFSAALATSGSYRVAIGGGVAAVVANQIGLHQTPPRARGK